MSVIEDIFELILESVDSIWCSIHLENAVETWVLKGKVIRARSASFLRFFRGFFVPADVL